jgi:hypothetical protein
MTCQRQSGGICRRMRRIFIARRSITLFVAHSGDEERAHRIAWGAVKRSYVKVGQSWVARAERSH